MIHDTQLLVRDFFMVSKLGSELQLSLNQMASQTRWHPATENMMTTLFLGRNTHSLYIFHPLGG